MTRREVRRNLTRAFGALTDAQLRRLCRHLELGHGVACGEHAYVFVSPDGYG